MRVPGSWPLIGRAEELALLTAILADGGGRGVVLSGPAGVGKTRLANEVVEQAASAGRGTAWTAASRALAGIPFGAFAHLLPGSDVSPVSPLDLLRRAHDELRRRSPHRPLVLGVDDAHLLDEASAGLVHQLAAAGTAFVVATVRDGDPVPRAVRALWKDGLAERVELAPMSRTGVAELLAGVLDGQVDTATAHRLWQASEGNVLLLRELVLLGVARGALARRHGVWSWHGALGVGSRLVELIDERLAGLAGEQRAALEVLAVGEPLPAPLFESIVGTELAHALEQADVLVTATHGPVELARVSHPLYGEIVRAGLRPLGHRAICRRLAAAAVGGGCDLLRVATWHLDGGAELDAATLTAAARRAAHLGDHELGERLARAAVAAGGGMPAALVLAESLQSQGRVAQCRAELDGLDVGALDPAESTRWALVAATNAFWGYGDTDGADEVLVGAQARLPAGDLRDQLLGHRAAILIYGGRPVEALSVAEPALGRVGTGEDSRLRLGRAVVLALGALGQSDRAIALADDLLDRPRGPAEERPLIMDLIATARMNAYWLAGRYAEMEASVAPRYQLMVVRGSHDLLGLVAGQWGRALFGLGQLGPACVRLRESAALLRGSDPVGMLILMLCTLARAETQLGDQDGAESTLAECERRINPAIRIVAPYLLLARAWVTHGAGEHSRARSHAVAAADLAASMRYHPIELEALHEAVRLGEPGLADRLARVADRVDHALAPDYAAHAAALARADGDALDACAARFAEHHVHLLAAEASVEAAEVHARAGRRGPEMTALDRAHRWAGQCQGARTPVLARSRHAPAAARLTAREREVADLAVSGLSNADIAARLVLSRRTVGNHLTNIYDKLAVTCRAELAVRLPRER